MTQSLRMKQNFLKLLTKITYLLFKDSIVMAGHNNCANQVQTLYDYVEPDRGDSFGPITCFLVILISRLILSIAFNIVISWAKIVLA